MQVNSIKNTVFIFVGEAHCDPAPVGLIKQYIKKFHQEGIPQIFCAEHPHNETFEETKVNEQEIANEISKYVDFFKYLAKNNPELAFPYFTSEDKHKIEFKLFEAGINVGIEREGCADVAVQIVNYIHNLENLQLNQVLSDLQIPFQGIELESSEHDEFYMKLITTPTSDSNNLAISNEKYRIEAMVQKLFEKALPLLKENNGIVWVNCGALHIHNLAVVTLKHIQENLLTINNSYTLLPITCYSEYGKEQYKDAIILRQLFQMRASFKQTKYSSLFEKIPYYVVENVQEEQMHSYQSKKFDELMSYAKGSFQKTNCYYIPEWNIEKEKIVKEFQGIIQSVEGNNAIISIVSEILLQPLREVLGIDRKKITIKKSFTEKRTLLEEQPTITVEALPSPNQLLITFPMSKHNFVKSVVESVLK